jgi:ribose transport system permease protein
VSTEAERGKVRSGSGPSLAFVASNEVGLLLITVGFAALFYALTPGFGSPFNVYALTRVLAIDIVIGFSMMVVLVTGGLNLAVGAIGVCAVMVGGWAMQEAALPVPIAAALALAAGGALGMVNGILTVVMRVHSFVVTLATMSLFFGAMIVITQAEAFNALPPGFVSLAKERTVFFVSSMIYVSLGLGVLLWWFFHHTLVGRQILAAGANPAAARLSGVPVERTVVVCHGLSGALAAVAGLMLAARNGAALPSMAGQLGIDWLLPAFLAPILGGTLLTGGTLSVTGTILGACLVTVLSNGLLQLRVGEFWVQAFLGIILLVAVALDRLRAHLMARQRLS